MAWLLVALVPASALFSALCLALAAFARSSKEGQYYLMPLILVTMPLMVLPMAPGVELTLGNSLIPLTGLILLLRMLLEGNVVEALALHSAGGAGDVRLLPDGDAVGGRSVQSRECAVPRERAAGTCGFGSSICGATAAIRRPSAAAVACGVLILVVQFVLTFTISPPTGGGFGGLAQLILISELIAILLPTLALTLLLTRRPAQTLLIRRTPLKTILAAAVLALAVHPLNYAMQWIIQSLYPVGPGGEEFKKIDSPSATARLVAAAGTYRSVAGCVRRVGISRIHSLWLAT